MLKPFIDGTSCESSTSATEEIINPATGEVVATAPRGSGDDVDRAVEAAKRAFPTWASTPPKERSEALLEIAKRLEDAIDEFAKLESENAGKPLAHAYGEVQRSADRLRFFAGASRSLTTPATGEYLPGTTSLVRREPVGVAGLIAPWNYPLHMAVWKLAPALAAGNTCVLKPSELTPLTALAFARLTEGVLPAGVLNVISGAGKTAGALLAQHADVRLVSLTGSVVTGRTVARLAADSLKRLHLELGGKAPAVVLSDADPKQVAAGLRVGSFWNSGQDCTAATRVIVASEVFDDVVRELADMAADVHVANPTDPRCEMGPLISRAHRARVIGFVDRAVDSGATVVAGGDATDGAGAYMAPTVITNVKQSDEIIQEEVFGPVITVQRVPDDDAALRIANDTKYGLAASVWTLNLNKAMRFSGGLAFGTVWVNTHGPITSEMPFGGFNQSGYGKDLSIYALDEFTQIKHVMINHREGDR